MAARPSRVDVAVVGAGVAGLAAARNLEAHGLRVLVLEGRARIGGRVFTRHVPEVPVPIELGAEFLHGESPRTERVLDEAGAWAIEATGGHLELRRGHARRVAYWRDVDRVLGRIGRRGRDFSLGEFLAHRPGGRDLARARSRARDFVQGFHAADPDEVSARSIAPGPGESATGAAARVARIAQGYAVVPATLARPLRRAIRLGHAVTRIDWRRGEVEITAHASAGGIARVRARAAVVTVPVGVLERDPAAAGALRFEPDPPRLRRALAGIAMGSAARLVVAFREPPWALHCRSASAIGDEPVAFLHLPAPGPFRVWWTAHPARVPVLVAWSGGPPAARLAGQSRKDVLHAALSGLALGLGRSLPRLEQAVAGSWLHDWQADPFARGAYSHARVGGSDAAAGLSRPFDGTLFFAGEATDAMAPGTVEGALDSGLRAARQVRRALGLSPAGARSRR